MNTPGNGPDKSPQEQPAVGRLKISAVLAVHRSFFSLEEMQRIQQARCLSVASNFIEACQRIKQIVEGGLAEMWEEDGLPRAQALARGETGEHLQSMINSPLYQGWIPEDYQLLLAYLDKPWERAPVPPPSPRTNISEWAENEGAHFSDEELEAIIAYVGSCGMESLPTDFRSHLVTIRKTKDLVPTTISNLQALARGDQGEGTQAAILENFRKTVYKEWTENDFKLLLTLLGESWEL